MSKTILITGAFSGFGLLTARLALSRGWAVAAASRHPEAPARDDEARERWLPLRMDVSDRASVREGLQAMEERFGAPEAVVNNAGIGLLGAAEEVTPEALRRQFETNFFGAVELTRAVLPAMRARGGGRLVFVSSDLGRTGAPGLSAYCATKHALEGWAESLFHEVAPFGIGVTIIEPGAFRTGFHERSMEVAAGVKEPDGPYAPLYRSLAAGFFGGPEPPTGEAVAEAVLRAAEGREPRLRVPVGADAVEWSRGRFVADEEVFIRELARRFGWNAWRKP
ncbi:MAG: SDR family oxidoreductase [Acidobacteriota bacterium]